VFYADDLVFLRKPLYTVNEARMGETRKTFRILVERSHEK
jgi:hypothetical protein